MTRVIPWRQEPEFRQSVTLGRRRFVIRARWNTRYEYWTYDLLTIQGDILIAGQRINKGWPTLSRYSNRDLPSGFIAAFDPADIRNRIPIGRESLTDGVLMIFVSNAQMLAGADDPV